MLTGATSITFGDATVVGKSIRNDIGSIRPNIGYCPQFDALDSKLTPKEHLFFYANIRNLPTSKTDEVIQELSILMILIAIAEF